jgi:hypothetical protein
VVVDGSASAAAGETVPCSPLQGLTSGCLAPGCGTGRRPAAPDQAGHGEEQRESGGHHDPRSRPRAYPARVLAGYAGSWLKTARRYSPASSNRITKTTCPCVAIARPYAQNVSGISCRARRNAGFSGRTGLRFCAVAVMAGRARQARHGTANAVWW